MLFAALPLALAVACAGVKQGVTSGNGGTGGTTTINGLSALMVSPTLSTVTLMQAAAGGLTTATVQLTATGTVMGAAEDVTSRVAWTSHPTGASVVGGLVTVTAPGTFAITATSGQFTASASVVATFSGDVFGTGFDTTNGNKGALDGAPGGQATLAYPLDSALFPSNMTPIYAHIQASGATIARLNFQGMGVNVKFYGNCESGLPGGGCYVRMPLSLTQLFIAPSEQGDIALTARAFGNGSGLLEAPAVNIAWADVPLSGGLYYWSVIPPPLTHASNPTPGTYVLLDPSQTSGTAIYRYAFDANGGMPTAVWTDDGGPAGTTPYGGAPQAFDNGTAGGHCIGCHAISNDGRYMTLTIGGSSSTDGANFSLLDIAMQTLININPSASTDPNSSPTNDPTDYWKKFRMEGLATENAWGPNGDILVSMFGSKLYRTNVTVTGATGTATRVGPLFATSNTEYQSDPYWSHDGSMFVFTSFDQTDVGNYNTTGLNGDMKRRGKICIATASATGVNDDAHDLITRGNNVTSFYPSLSSDSKLVVFNQSNCGTDPDSDKLSTDYGNQTCDGYDDSSTTLWVVSPGGGASTKLGLANGTGAYDNSWPRFSPDKGIFRGGDLYWLAFSSRRPYGLQLNGSSLAPTATKPQLWIAGIRTGVEFLNDPSLAPVWLSEQNTNQAAPNGNHVPQWVKVAVVIN